MPSTRAPHCCRWMVATRRWREIGCSSALTVHCARRGRALEAKREEGAPRASVRRPRAVDRPAQVNPASAQPQLLSRGRQAPRSRRASRRAELLRLRRRRPPHSSQASSAVCRRTVALASAGAAAPSASAETWPSGPQKALALGSVAAAAPPELVPPHPAGAGRGSAKLPCVEYSLPARSSRSESDGLCVGKRGVRGARLIEGG